MSDTTLPNDDRPVGERIAELAESLPQEMVEQLPTDGASRLDHYLYAAQWTPKPPFGDSWIEYVIAQPCGHHNRDDDRRYARAELEALRAENQRFRAACELVVNWKKWDSPAESLRSDHPRLVCRRVLAGKESEA